MMRSPGSTTRLFFIAVLYGVTGCSLSRDTPPVEQYVLSSARAVDAAATPVPAGMTLGMRRLDLAAYLATPFIVVRHGDHEIDTSQYHRWGEELGHGISRALAGHLEAAAPIRAVDVAPWPVRTDHDYLLQLRVSRFEGVVVSDVPAATGAVHVAASWEILRPGDGAVLARGGTNYRQPGWRVGDYAALVATLEEGLRRLAHDVVTCVQQLAAVTPPPAELERDWPLACVS
jgi:uncharacterized lipoprotein YmbA